MHNSYGLQLLHGRECVTFCIQNCKGRKKSPALEKRADGIQKSLQRVSSLILLCVSTQCSDDTTLVQRCMFQLLPGIWRSVFHRAKKGMRKLISGLAGCRASSACSRQSLCVSTLPRSTRNNTHTHMHTSTHKHTRSSSHQTQHAASTVAAAIEGIS